MKKSTLILILFILAKFVLQYTLISPEYELHRDEYLHIDQGNHLAWGYLSVPPVNSWIAWVIIILGGSVFWVKFFPALFGALTILVVWKIIEVLKGSLYAQILASTGILFSVLLRLNMLFQPTSLEVLCWTMIYYSLIRYFNEKKIAWLYIGAVIFGLGMLNKYNIVFLPLGLIPALLLTRQRNIFLQPHLYGAAAIAFIIVLPNLLWQYNNGFPVIHHMKELSERQLININRLDFMKSQILFFVGVIFVIIAGFYALVFYKPFEKFRFLFWGYIFTIALFLFFQAKDYYAIGLYPVYIASGSVYLSHLFEKRKKILQPVSILIPVLLFLPLYSVAFPNKSPQYILNHQEKYKKLGLLRWEDGKDHSLPQDFADMQGWKELAQKVDKEFSKFPYSENTLVLCDNYGQAGAINYYSVKRIKAVSFNADYINWFDLSEKYVNLIRVKEYSEDKEDELEETGAFFENSKIVDSITNAFAREKGTRIFSFAKANIDIKKRIQEEINEQKNRD